MAEPLCTISLGNHPGMQCIHHRYRFLLPYSATYVRLQILDFPHDLVQHLHVTQGLFCQRALVGRMQFKELTSGMGHAADFRHAEFEAGLVTAEIIADQLALTQQTRSGY